MKFVSNLVTVYSNQQMLFWRGWIIQSPDIWLLISYAQDLNFWNWNRISKSTYVDLHRMFQIMRHPEPETFDYINKHPMLIRTWFEQVRVFNSCIVTPASTSILSTMMLIHLQTKQPIRRFHCETSGATIWVHMNSQQFTSGAQMLKLS
jgi:hypothetical protein